MIFSRRLAATIEAIREAISKSPLEFVPAPEGGWPRREDHVRFHNSSASVFYLETAKRPRDGKRVESFDLAVAEPMHGAWATFVNGDLVALTLDSIKCQVSLLDPELVRVMKQVLLKIRQADGKHASRS